MDLTFRPATRDPWRSRMRRAAESLRLLDESRFQTEIARIDECLRRDAAWGLEAALASCDRWRQTASPVAPELGA